MKRVINKIKWYIAIALNWVKYHFVGYKVDIIKAEVTIGKLTSRIDDNFDDLESRIDVLDEDINGYCIELEKSIEKIDKRVKELEPTELHEMLQTPFKDDECNICDDVGRTCAELQTELDKVKDELKEYKHSYNMVLLEIKEVINNNINLTSEKE